MNAVAGDPAFCRAAPSIAATHCSATNKSTDPTSQRHILRRRFSFRIGPLVDLERISGTSLRTLFFRLSAEPTSPGAIREVRTTHPVRVKGCCGRCREATSLRPLYLHDPETDGSAALRENHAWRAASGLGGGVRARRGEAAIPPVPAAERGVVSRCVEAATAMSGDGARNRGRLDERMGGDARTFLSPW